jgi:hypothetical protein
MNKLETAYSERLTAQGLPWFYERVTFKLADDTRYTPDFLVLMPDNTMHFHETKGFMRDDANVKIKVAASMFPFFGFTLVTRKGGEWILKEIGIAP